MINQDEQLHRFSKQLGQSVVNLELDRSMKTQEWLFRTYIGCDDNQKRVDALLESLKKK